jgi:hypothetical protein
MTNQVAPLGLGPVAWTRTDRHSAGFWILNVLIAALLFKSLLPF